jgi:hypothetical protein
MVAERFVEAGMRTGGKLRVKTVRMERLMKFFLASGRDEGCKRGLSRNTQSSTFVSRIMTYGAAIIAIICVFLCAWSLMVAMNPKRWRIWWMTFLRRVDIETSRQERRAQEHHLLIIGYVAFSLFLVTGALCGYLAWSEWETSRNPRSEADMVKDSVMNDVKKMQAKKPFRKLD